MDKVCKQCEVILSEGRVPVDKVCEQCEMSCQGALGLWTKCEQHYYYYYYYYY